MKANPDGTKRCSRCGETKRVGEFGRHRGRSDGLNCYCKECLNAHQREYDQRPYVKARKRAAAKACVTDPKTRLNNYMRFWIFHSIRRRGGGWQWELEVGYTIDDLIAHLETHFADDMSWENFGDWRVEHVVPRRKFDYTSAEDPRFRECWALSNLRPEWR